MSRLFIKRLGLLTLAGAMLLPAAVLAAELVDPRDPYQDAAAETQLKSYFLRRIANCPLPTDPAFPIAKDTSAHSRGIFLSTTSLDELDGLFDTIARNIQLRLIE